MACFEKLIEKTEGKYKQVPNDPEPFMGFGTNRSRALISLKEESVRTG